MSAPSCPYSAHMASKVCPVEPKVYGLIAEFDVVGDVRHAAIEARKAGYEKVDVHSSFPIHGIDDVLGIKPTILPWMCLVMGLVGMTTGIFLTTYCMADWIPHAVPGVGSLPVNFEGYTFIISGKPMLAIPAYVPPIFELTIMFSAYTAVFGMFLLNRLPTLSHPLFSSERFRRATQDRLFLAIEAEDAKFNLAQTKAFLESQHGVLAVEVVND